MSSVTTFYLEMTNVDQLRPKSCVDPRFRIREDTVKQWCFNRFLYKLVGEEWAWKDTEARVKTASGSTPEPCPLSHKIVGLCDKTIFRKYGIMKLI